MMPSIELRLRTLIRAVGEVIVPAIDPSNSLAQEQARLLLGHLHAISLQLGHEAALIARDDDAVRRLARALLASAEGGVHTRAAQAALADTVDTTRGALLAAIDAFVLASGVDGSDACRQASWRLVLDDARATAWHGRAWFRAMGYEDDPAAVPDIPTLLAAASASDAKD
ncbi:MAG: hypothetical protein AB7I32_02535 [Gammaproteobacteria bacterium]